MVHDSRIIAALLDATLGRHFDLHNSYALIDLVITNRGTCCGK